MANKKMLYFGERYPLAQSMFDFCKHGGFEILSKLPDQAHVDIVVDNASTSVVELRSRLKVLSHRVGHYILVSSCVVYPSQSRLRPWCEDEIDVCSDLFPSLSPEVHAARALERELCLRATAGRFEYSIVRPAMLDKSEQEAGLTRWFVRRIMDGGLVVLPEGDLPNYRLIQPQELAEALMLIAGQPRAYGATLNVANQAVLSYWGHAAIVRDALRIPLRFGYVPQWRWRSVGLTLPAGETGSASFIEPAGLLAQLGWRPADPVEGIRATARRCRKSEPCGTDASVALARETLRQVEQNARVEPAGAQSKAHAIETPQWALHAWPGSPAGISLERIAQSPRLPQPLLKVKALSLGASEEMLLRGEYPQRGSRVIGHNALLEVLQSGSSGLVAGTLALPVATLGCGDPECYFCRDNANGVLGIGCDGYGWGICTTPEQHLIGIPEDLGYTALLADPLAALQVAVGEELEAGSGPVWIAGRTIEALLVAWLAEDAGRPVIRVDRRDWNCSELPVTAAARLLEDVQQGRQPAPTLSIDFTGCADVAWTVGCALQRGSSLFVRSRPPGIPSDISWRMLPSAAPDRSSLQRALALLEEWKLFRDVSARVGPAVPLDRSWDMFLPASFTLPYLEDCA